jgi:hypothetical protein
MSRWELFWVRASIGGAMFAHLHPGSRANVIAIGLTGLAWIIYAFAAHLRSMFADVLEPF